MRCVSNTKRCGVVSQNKMSQRQGSATTEAQFLVTTLEVSNLGRYGFMGGHGGSLATQMDHHHTAVLQADADGSFLGDAMPVGGLSHGCGCH